MKKIIFALIVGFVLFAGCAGEKNAAVTEPPASVSEKGGPKLQPLTQKYVHGLSEKDSARFFVEVFFYNSVAIDLKLLVIDKTRSFSTENGVAHKGPPEGADLTRSVPEMTDGYIIDWRFGKSNPSILMAVLVTFDLEDRTYHFKFFRRSDGFFQLGAEAEIVFEGQTYQVYATIPSDEVCLLMFYGIEDSPKPKESKENAKGVGNSSSNSGSPSQGEPKKEEIIEW